MGTYYWDDATFIICVFDVSSRRSFSSCSKWIRAVRSSVGGGDGTGTVSGGGGDGNVGGGGRRRDNGKIPAILVANKTDLREGVSI